MMLMITKASLSFNCDMNIVSFCMNVTIEAENLLSTRTWDLKIGYKDHFGYY